jgi:hypothetical protein
MLSKISPFLESRDMMALGALIFSGVPIRPVRPPEQHKTNPACKTPPYHMPKMAYVKQKMAFFFSPE